MSIRAAVPRETDVGEKRVAVSPGIAERIVKLGITLALEPGAGAGSGMPDEEYAKFAAFEPEPSHLYGTADIVLGVGCPAAEHIRLMREGAILISFVHPRQHPTELRLLCERNITAFAMELVPRITRAQAIDALSSQAMIAGYRAVLLAAEKLERFFPMFTTAAGTIRPARVLVIGAGVAGLQAIATARRLGAQVEGYDIRAASREEVESLGARFVDTGIQAEGGDGYARELTDAERQAQREALALHISRADVVISTANVPGRPAPKIVLQPMVDAMKRGSVIVDLAAETGGNCELTEPGAEIRRNGVTILGPLNVPSMMAEEASRLYAQNVYNLLSLLVNNGEIRLDWDDEVIARTALTHAGEIKHESTRQLMGQGGQP